MRLRSQLLGVSLLLLSLPWAGCQFIRELEGALRQAQSQALQSTAAATAAALHGKNTLLYSHTQRLNETSDGTELYAFPHPQPIILDGYADGWEHIRETRLSSSAGAPELKISYRAATRGANLYLLLHVTDKDVIYHNPGLGGEANGDRLLLRTWPQGQRQEFVVATAAPGKVRGLPLGPVPRGADLDRIRGYWQDTAGGYSVELEIPLAYTGGRMGFLVINSTPPDTDRFESLGTIEPLQATPPPWLVYRPAALQQALLPFRSIAGNIEVVDKSGWVLAELDGNGHAGEVSKQTFWLLRLLYRRILASPATEMTDTSTRAGQVRGDEISSALSGRADSQRYSDAQRSGHSLLSSAVPIWDDRQVIGALVLRQSTELYLSLTDRAFGHLLGYSLLGLGIAFTGLFGYASLLSWRVGRLRRSVVAAISADGVIDSDFPRSQARDEIGELSRRYAELLDQLRAYNHYLTGLSRKLSHELRTPIAVVQSSLENLRHGDDSEAVYLQRAESGLLRLGKILTAMSEASGLEESIRSNPLNPLDLAPLIEELAAVYRGLYPSHQLRLGALPEAAHTLASADLVVQALDKILDNAASFCPPGGVIELNLRKVEEFWCIEVGNDGPSLPNALRDGLFQPMVSLRESGGERVHLGLGLHIVRLISDYHGGYCKAMNRSDQTGVVVVLGLPVAPPGQSRRAARHPAPE